MKILVVEDEKELRERITFFLQQEGFVCEKADSYFTAEDKLAAFDYDVIILDITLPDGNGLDLLQKIKTKNNNTGIIIVSARDALDDKLHGLDLGADDYITKPFHLSELNARIRAVLRRRKFDGTRKLVFNEFQLFPEQREVFIHQKKLQLTPKEYEMLLYFVINKNRVLTRQSIAEHLWGDYMDMADRFDFVYTHLNNLRKKIKNAGGNDYIKTIYGIGYKMEAH
ncbi:response regulator transcription factor [Candidatus Sulfidibacterium hydrothermale]|uniref:response regulator transcription factor n=1 Tax=Candidatus Sulfidibacterium hydrothermale TaxID=2875962 RepID=UPI001F0B5406|nr:response regulator transcription factor [Candidatus Sulfidibacterium hydrothermale]UBM63124.1 response regulator transcription factor [Candidatus Sulfidibacterium hydrothermale]